MTTLPARELAVVAGARTVQLTAYRIIYPLAPFLAAQLGVDLGMVALLITVQVLASLFSPLGGVLATRSGQRTAMLLGQAVFVLGTGLCALAPNFWGFLVGYGLIGLAVSIYHPSAQSYLSARTSYARRGYALGIYEVSWAAAALLGVAPLMVLVDQTDRPQIAFIVLAVAGLASLVVVRAALPQGDKLTRGTGEHFSWRVLLLPGVAALLAVLLFTMAGCDLVFIVQSAWLQASFGAQASLVGAVAAIQGASELLGSLGSAVLVDRVGKKRSVLLGFGMVAAAALLLPLTSGQWLLFLPVSLLFVLGFEFGIVSSFPLASGVAPAARTAVLSLCTVAVGLGRTLASLVAEPLWSVYGIGANALACAGLVIVGLVICGLAVREQEAAED
ncbi:MAG: MFS transporter [Roseiflexaceae bacterium]|nr:MFS transporter [Roseiflexaceae bacterium]